MAQSNPSSILCRRMWDIRGWTMFAAIVLCGAGPFWVSGAVEPPATVRTYQNELRIVENPRPILADFPEFVQPVVDVRRYLAPRLIDDAGADLDVHSWRFSYNARGIIEVPHRLKGSKTAVIVVHPWGIDDGQGWTSPEPAGVAFACTPEKNRVMLEHGALVLNPLLKALRPHVGLVIYSLPGSPDPIRSKLYRTLDATPGLAERAAAAEQLTRALKGYNYRGAALVDTITLTTGRPAVDYFNQFPGLDASARYDGAGFWDLPIPVMNTIDVAPDDVVLFDQQGYPRLKEFLEAHGIEHVLLCGYHADMCVCATTAGHDNLRKHFNTFLVGDAVQSSLPANTRSNYATNQTVSFASLQMFITQASWIHTPDGKPAIAPGVRAASR